MRSVFSVGSAVLRVVEIPGDVSRYIYSGPMTAQTFEILRSHGIRHAKGQTIVLADVRFLVPLASKFQSFKPRLNAARFAPTAAMVCYPELHRLWQSYVLQGAKDGVARAIFTDFYEAEAWARRLLPAPLAHQLGPPPQQFRSLQKGQACIEQISCELLPGQ